MRCGGLGLVVLVSGCLDTNPLFVDPTETPGEVTGQATGGTVEPTSMPGPTTDSSTSSPVDPTGDGATTLLDDTTGEAYTTDLSDTETPSTCGDGAEDPGEQCDDGNKVDDDACRNDCTLPVCGDEIVQGDEGCDDGNLDETDDCTSKCLPAVCGDGHVYINGAEQCDDANFDETDGCDNQCLFTKKYIFVTSAQYDGDLGGMPGADLKCMERAAAGELPPGVYLAWLSDSKTSPAMRMKEHPGPYILPGFGEPVIALGWGDLTDGTIAAPIDRDEAGNSLLPTFEGCNMAGVMTNTDSAGDPVSKVLMNTCYDWTSTQGATSWGSTMATDDQWTNDCGGDFCGFYAPIVCVQQ